jgi:hypothetical protein
MAFNGTTFNLTNLNTRFPATATLTYTSYAAGAATFTLSSILSASILISRWTVAGYNSSGCTTNVQNDSANNVTIPQGAIRGLQDGATPMTATSTFYIRGSSITVNGIARTTGQTFVVGQTTVTVTIVATCTAYAT